MIFSVSESIQWITSLETNVINFPFISYEFVLRQVFAFQSYPLGSASFGSLAVVARPTAGLTSCSTCWLHRLDWLSSWAGSDWTSCWLPGVIDPISPDCLRFRQSLRLWAHLSLSIHSSHFPPSLTNLTDWISESDWVTDFERRELSGFNFEGVKFGLKNFRIIVRLQLEFGLFPVEEYLWLPRFFSYRRVVSWIELLHPHNSFPTCYSLVQHLWRIRFHH